MSIARLLVISLVIIAFPVLARAQSIGTPSSVQCAQLPLGSTCFIEVTGVNMASTGDVATFTVPSVGTIVAQGAFMQNCSGGAVGSYSATIRTATGGGGAALATFTTTTPPASGFIVPSTATATTTLADTTVQTTLTLNESATTATGTCSFLFRFFKFPAT
jgi:hypothetical protein